MQYKQKHTNSYTNAIAPIKKACYNKSLAAQSQKKYKLYFRMLCGTIGQMTEILLRFQIN